MAIFQGGQHLGVGGEGKGGNYFHNYTQLFLELKQMEVFVSLSVCLYFFLQACSSVCNYYLQGRRVQACANVCFTVGREEGASLLESMC